MRIAEYSMEFSSQRTALENSRRSLSVAVGAAPAPPATAALPDAASGVARAVRGGPAVTPPAVATNPVAEAAGGRQRVGIAPTEVELPSMDSLRMQLLRLLLERLTGREINVIDPADLKPDEDLEVPAVAGPPGAAADSPARPAIAWSLQETRIEIERTDFQARGMVQTADGQRIDIAIDVSMSRQFVEQRSLQGRLEGDLQDPLVINFDAPAAALTDTRFAFDLDADGEEQQIAFLRPGSGFLALDRNGNGQVDDGRELFGPLTGDGFADLRRHDADGNGWVDAADPIYDRLRVWTRDAQGRDQLLALGEVGVGAIYLGHVSTPFDLRHTQDNELLGQVRSTGLWVAEDGRTGTAQQIDLTA
ncbi:MAG: hypothetical protein ACQETK_05335 [Pseudomonadota bacterium]